MNILFVSSGNNRYGISPIVKSQGESLKKVGCNVEYFTIRRKGATGYLAESRRLRKHLKRHRYELLHAHYGLSAITAFLGNRGHPLVVSFMGDDLMGSNKPGGSITMRSRILALINRLMARFVYSHSIVKTDKMGAGLGHSNISVIQNGVDLQVFHPMNKKEAREKLEIPVDEFLILFVSDSDRPEKNFSLASEAVRELKREDVRLKLLHGRPQEEVCTWLNAADVLVLTSYHEGSPNVVKEAMACNCPIVSTDVGDVREVMGDTSGCFIGAYDAEHFSGQLDRALRFSEAEGRTGGRERIRELGLDAHRTARRIAHVYRTVLKRSL